MAFTFLSANIAIKSAARSRSVPARNPSRARTFLASLGLKPNRPSAAAARSTAFGSGGALAGATRPTVSPGQRRSGLSRFFTGENGCYKTAKKATTFSFRLSGGGLKLLAVQFKRKRKSNHGCQYFPSRRGNSTAHLARCAARL